CGGDSGGATTPSTPPTSAPPAPSPPSLAISFVEATATLAEGETAEIPVRWSGGPSGSALQIGVVAQNQTATDEDYEVLSEGFAIPQSAASGTAMVSLRALEDDFFAEGDETLSVQLVAPSGAAVQVGGSLEVAIEDAGVSPCAGIRIAADPPSLRDLWEPGKTEQPSETAMTRFIVVSGPGSEAVALDWVGPYRDYDLSAWNPSFRRRNVNSSTLFHTILANWTFLPEASALRHEIRLEWLSNLEVGLRFRSSDGACAGEPVAVCTGAGCELRP
ncbi:MAG: hypothetical protein OXL34_02755, partial [Gemmatimonadota bacterium]|nr:hypothetical protein [Gemmatimonadota bacterium]